MVHHDDMFAISEFSMFHISDVPNSVGLNYRDNLINVISHCLLSPISFLTSIMLLWSSQSPW